MTNVTRDRDFYGCVLWVALSVTSPVFPTPETERPKPLTAEEERELNQATFRILLESELEDCRTIMLNGPGDAVSRAFAAEMSALSFFKALLWFGTHAADFKKHGITTGDVTAVLRQKRQELREAHGIKG